MTNANLQHIIKQLVAMGEDEKELEFWQEIFEHLTPEEKMELYQELSAELAELKSFHADSDS